jgi:hypothetical protein
MKYVMYHASRKWPQDVGVSCAGQRSSIRRVIFPLERRDFALDEGIGHGARLWANLLSLMVTHAWLEHRNRSVLELGEGAVAIEAIPDDYATAYRIFDKVCKRTVANISDTHRKIFNSLYGFLRAFLRRPP